MTFTDFKSLIEYFVGTYTSTGDTIANCDWAWIAGAILLLHLVFFFFKAVAKIFWRVGK